MSLTFILIIAFPLIPYILMIYTRVEIIKSFKNNMKYTKNWYTFDSIWHSERRDFALHHLEVSGINEKNIESKLKDLLRDISAVEESIVMPRKIFNFFQVLANYVNIKDKESGINFDVPIKNYNIYQEPLREFCSEMLIRNSKGLNKNLKEIKKKSMNDNQKKLEKLGIIFWLIIFPIYTVIDLYNGIRIERMLDYYFTTPFIMWILFFVFPYIFSSITKNFRRI